VIGMFLHFLSLLSAVINVNCRYKTLVAEFKVCVLVFIKYWYT